MKKARHRGEPHSVATDQQGDMLADEFGTQGVEGPAEAEPAPAAPPEQSAAEAQGTRAGPEGLAGAHPEIDRLAAEVAALNERHLRLAAEYQNYRRRSESESSEAGGRAQVEVVRRFLDVYDDLQRVSALDPSAAATVQSVVEGVDLVERKFGRALEDVGVEAVEPAPGDRFDPVTMEAVMRVPAEAPADDDTVHQSFQKGYRFKSLLLRPARVSVRKHE